MALLSMSATIQFSLKFKKKNPNKITQRATFCLGGKEKA